MHKAPHHALIAAGFFGLVALIAGCSGSKAALERNPAPCPNVLVLSEAARLIDFDGEQTLDDIAWTGEIEDVVLSCRYFDDKPIKAELEIAFSLGKGPRGDSNSHDFIYFVAVTRRDQEVIAKRDLAVRGKFSRSSNTYTTKVKLDDIVIPRANEKTSGTNFEIIVGFALDREQALYNRSGKSLKFPHL